MARSENTMAEGSSPEAETVIQKGSPVQKYHPEEGKETITKEEAGHRLEEADRQRQERQQRQNLVNGESGGRASTPAETAGIQQTLTDIHDVLVRMEERQRETPGTPEQIRELTDQLAQQLYDARQGGASQEQLDQMLRDRLAPRPGAERYGFLNIPENHEWEWLRTQLATLESGSSEIPQHNISLIIQAIQVLGKPDLEKKMLAELFARYALHNGALALSRVNLEGWMGMMGSQPVTFIDTISKVDQVEEAIGFFEEESVTSDEQNLAPHLKLANGPKMIQVFSAPALHQDETVRDKYGNEIYAIKREEKIKSGFYDFLFFKNLFKTTLLLKLMDEDSSVREGEEDISSIKQQLIGAIKKEFSEGKSGDRSLDEALEKQIEDILAERGLLSQDEEVATRQKAKIARLRSQAQTAVNLADKMYRVTGIAASCDVPKYYKRDIPELGAKKDKVVIPYAKGFRRKADDPEKVEQVLMEKGKVVKGGREEMFDYAGNLVVATEGGKDDEEEVVARAVRQGRPVYRVVLTDDDERVDPTAVQEGSVVTNSRLAQRGSGEYALWRIMWAPAYAERLERGIPELREYFRTGAVNFTIFKVLPGAANSKENAHTLVLERNAQGKTVMSGAKLAEAGLKKLLTNVRTGAWNSADWGDWLGNIKQADDNRNGIESREGWLWNPSPAAIQVAAVKLYQNFKDKLFDRQVALGGMAEGTIEYNTSKEIVKKYHGPKARPWSFRTDEKYFLDWLQKRAILPTREVERIRKHFHPRFWTRLAESSKEVAGPIFGESFLEMLRALSKQLTNISGR